MKSPKNRFRCCFVQIKSRFQQPIKSRLIVLIVFFIVTHPNAQTLEVDSLPPTQPDKFNYKSLILPTALIGYGVFGLENHTIKSINMTTQNELVEHIDNKITIDDFAQYSPFLSVYALNAVGLKGKNSLKDRTIILVTAYLIMGGTVNILKYTGRVQRPDGTSKNSFPSGHTATAFMGAEFLRQEYNDVSVWYGISGYMVATGIGIFRMYNNRHWLTDVACGAGIGILSTKIAYWINPLLKRIFYKQNKTINAMITPFYNGKNYGLGIALSL